MSKTPRGTSHPTQGENVPFRTGGERGGESLEFAFQVDLPQPGAAGTRTVTNTPLPKERSSNSFIRVGLKR